jgi:hypothetical protein
MDTRIGFGSCDSTTKSKKQSSGNSYLNLETGTNLGSLSYTSRLKVIKLASGEILFSKGSCFLPHADIFEHMSGQISLTLFSCLLCHLDRLFAFQEPSLGLFGLLTLSKNTPYLETDTFTDTKITQTQCTQTQNTSKDYKTQT